MSKRSSNFKHSLPGLFWLLLFIPLLIGCDTGIPGTINASTPIGSQKGPGSVNLTATARATPVATSCSNIHVMPASTSGWSIYKDTHFPFQFATPLGWRAGSFTDNGGDYIVQVFPPYSTTPFGEAGIADPEHISIAIAPPGSTSSYTGDPNWRPEANTITISGARTTVYDRTSPDCAEVNRGATGDFGQHHFTFFLATVPGKAQGDIALFLGVLQSFVYGR